eukprot:SAG22_NODE_593_length_8808_cov_21.674590_7_plen_99_part_00
MLDPGNGEIYGFNLFARGGGPDLVEQDDFVMKDKKQVKSLVDACTPLVAFFFSAGATACFSSRCAEVSSVSSYSAAAAAFFPPAILKAESERVSTPAQ